MPIWGSYWRRRRRRRPRRSTSFDANFLPNGRLLQITTYTSLGPSSSMLYVQECSIMGLISPIACPGLSSWLISSWLGSAGLPWPLAWWRWGRPSAGAQQTMQAAADATGGQPGPQRQPSNGLCYIVFWRRARVGGRILKKMSSGGPTSCLVETITVGGAT